MFTLRQCLQLTSVSILLLLTSALIANSIIGQQCIPASNISEILRIRAPNPSDGKIHITYSFSESNLSTTSKAAFDNAIGQWNSKSGSTGVFFDPAPAGSSGDVEFKRSTDPADTGGCAAYRPATTRVYYGAEWETRAANVTDGATVIAHELGHFLGLDEAGVNPANPTIMNNPVVPPGGNPCLNGTVTTKTVQASDATKSGSCITAARPTPTPTPTPEPDPCASQVEGSGLVIANALCEGDGGDLTESGSTECNDGIDNDQDGMVDCDDPSCPRCPSGCSNYQQELCFAVGAMGCWQGMCYTPILIDVNGDGYKMTNAANGVSFKVLPNLRVARLSWTAENSDDAWLVLDRNGNATIDSGEEQFGNATPQPWSVEKNGFKALAQYDSIFYGGNEDGVIDGLDAVFAQLQLWCDRNHNGISEPDELSDLPSAGLFGIDLNYKEWKKVDEFGNPFRYRAKLLDGSGHSLGKWAFDVFLKTY